MVAVSLVQDPTLVQIMRSTEIILTMATEAVYVGSAPDPAAALGSLLVTACVGLWRPMIPSYRESRDHVIQRLQILCHSETAILLERENKAKDC